MDKESIGGEIQVSLHWLTVTVFIEASKLVPVLLKALLNINLDETEAYAEGKWKEHFYEFGGGARGFNSLCINPFGLKLYRLPRATSAKGTYCSVELPGETIETFGQDAVLKLLEALHTGKWLWRATRVDIAFDNCPFTPLQCREAWLAGNVRTDAQQDSHRLLDSPQGQTFYIGSRSSTRFIRIYNRRGPTRLEIEIKKPMAEIIVQQIASSEFDVWRDMVLGKVRQYVDFVDASSAKTLAECALLPWWAEFVGCVARASESVMRPKRSANLLANTKTRLANLLPWLCVVKEGMGISIDVMCDGSQYRLKDHHHRKITALRMAMGDDSWIP